MVHILQGTQIKCKGTNKGDKVSQYIVNHILTMLTTTTTPQPFYGPFSVTTRVSRCQKRTSGLYGARKINRDGHTDHPAGHHSIRTNQCPPLPSPNVLQARCPSCRTTNSVKAQKATMLTE